MEPSATTMTRGVDLVGGEPAAVADPVDPEDGDLDVEALPRLPGNRPRRYLASPEPQ
ncbi:hypothetical protein ACQPZJ_30185 [Actinoplanes sp. CA-054009]